jgi:hypothetical protein
MNEGDLNNPPFLEKSDNMGSRNHSYFQMKLGARLLALDKFAVMSELSLDISNLDKKAQFNLKESAQEVRADLCLYPTQKINRLHDIIRMSEMPLSAIEIVSPRQGVFEITEKFKIFFELGVKSCWLVEPITGVITVFSSPDKARTFATGEVNDEILDIRLPIQDIFD